MLIEYVKNGRRQNVRPAVAKLLVRRKLAVLVEEQTADAAEKAPQAQSVRTYDTRMLTADTTEAAPYGYKADGTPRKRPAPLARSKAQD
jgi:hypothetical protein